MGIGSTKGLIHPYMICRPFVLNDCGAKKLWPQSHGRNSVSGLNSPSFSCSRDGAKAMGSRR